MARTPHWTKACRANDSLTMQPLATRSAARARAARTPCTALSLLLASLFALAPAGVRALDWNIDVTPSGELFPALELSQAKTGQDPANAGNGLLRIRIKGDGSARRVRLTVATDGLLVPAVVEAELDDELVLRPRLRWDVAALRGMLTARTQTLRLTLESEGRPPLSRNINVRVHPLDEALYFVRDGDARIDLGWAFAAWVDPHDPVVDELIELARSGSDVDLEPTTDRIGRLRQAQAVWLALERRGLRYADDAAGISQGPVIYSQRVRLLADTWNERVANCLDGSVLIASALERLGIRTMLVLVPGHAFVGFHTDAEGRDTEFLETTLLGNRAPDARDRPESPAQLKVRADAGFEAARNAGKARYRRAASRFDGRHRPNYAVIDISTARSYGIMPLAVGRHAASSTAPSTTPAPAFLHSQQRSAFP